MTARNWIALLAAFSGLGLAAWADDWQIVRYEGRDYVTLDNIASFYGFPAPPLVDAAALPNPPPLPSPLPLPAAAEPKPATEEPPLGDTLIALQNGGKGITLDDGKSRLVVIPNRRDAQIDGVTQWLDFPPVVQDGKVLISRLDLSKNLEPRLRPEKAVGLGPVTTVILDAGHGGHDHGAASNFGFEKDFALDVVLRVRDDLQKRGFKVLLTRASDIFIPLHERPAVANHVQDSIFVSIHFNCATSNSAARGFEIYSCAPRGAPATNDGAFSIRDLREEPANSVDTQSTILAGTIFHSLLGHLPLPDRGIKHARFAVLRLCTQPSVLVECGFVSNPADSSLIASPAWRAQVAESITTGIENYKELAEQHLAPKMVADYRRGVPVPTPTEPSATQ